MGGGRNGGGGKPGFELRPGSIDPRTPLTSNFRENGRAGASNWMNTEHTDSFPDSEMSSLRRHPRSPSTHEIDVLGGFLAVPSRMRDGKWTK